MIIANSILLNCIINGVKFTGFFNNWFLLGEDLANATYTHTRYDVNVALEDFEVDEIAKNEIFKVSTGSVL